MTGGAVSVGLVGLGSMGSGMARSILQAGLDLVVADIDPGKVADLVGQGAKEADRDRDAPRIGALVVVVLNAAQTEDVLFGPSGWAPLMRPGAVIVACATIAPEDARRFEALAARHGLHYLDAPISGGAARAAAGRLSVMASGRPEAFASAGPVLSAVAEVVHELGDSAGAGSAMKTVNQLLAGVHIAAMGEAMALAASQGLDLRRVVEVISSSAGTSWMFENRATHVVEGDYTPRSAIQIWPKDLAIVLSVAERAGLPVPMTETALGRYLAATEAGLGREDDAAVAKVYARAAGLKLPGEP